MFKPNTPYVALLKAKDGECRGLAQLSKTARNATIPFFDIPRPTELSGSKFDQQVLAALKRVIKFWGSNDAVYLDLFDLPLETRLTSGMHPVTGCHHLLARNGVATIPVYGFDRDAEYLNAVIGLPHLKRSGLCLRLLEEDYFDDINGLQDAIKDILGRARLKSADLDLLIDTRALANTSLSDVRTNILDAIPALLSIGEPRSIVVAGSNSLEDVSPIKKDSQALVERSEYTLWKNVATLSKRDAYIRFGDYGVVHPDFVELGPVKNVNAKIRYCVDEQWLVLRGHSLREPPKFEQYRRLARDLVLSEYFRGESFSWGDKYIVDCAYGR